MDNTYPTPEESTLNVDHVEFCNLFKTNDKWTAETHFASGKIVTTHFASELEAREYFGSLSRLLIAHNQKHNYIPTPKFD